MQIEPRPGTMDAAVLAEAPNDEYHAADYVRDGDCVLDVGAYIGSFVAHVKDIAPGARVIALEPMPSNHERLRENVADLAVLEQIALAERSGPLTMYDFGSDASACHSRYSLGVSDATEVTVQADTLARVMERHQLEHLRLLKLDCQGAELEILPSVPRDVLERIDYIAMEVHRRIAKAGAMLGEVPGAERRYHRMVRHLQRTHRLVHGESTMDSVQVWERRSLAGNGAGQPTVIERVRALLRR
jgi:FkbM family methyltransferase